MRVTTSLGLLLTLVGASAAAGPVPLPLPAGDVSDASRDVDCDGLTDVEEQTLRHGRDGTRTLVEIWDSDLDGVADGTELGRARSLDPRCKGVRLDHDPTTTTSPVDRDSDGDGLTDGQEDLNANGRVDAHETDVGRVDTDGDGASDLRERQQGTNPGRDAFSAFPEPLAFDLVRGLGARRGELEVNALFLVKPREGGTVDLVWAPEIEWAPVDGLALELELPFRHEQLAAVKLAAQGTLAEDGSGNWKHGWQLLLEQSVERPVLEVNALHLGNLRISPRFTAVSLLGAAAELSLDGARSASGIVNVTLAAAVSPLLTVAVEMNHRVELYSRLEPGWHYDARVLPQAHLQLNHVVRIQAGIGVEASVSARTAALSPVIAGRMVLEL